MTSCPYCPPLEPQQVVRFSDDLVMYLDDERWQRAEEVAATFAMLARAKHWLVRQHSPDGYNVGWNAGAVAGQQVFHAHLHVIPRFAQEPLAGQGIRAHLKGDDNAW